MIVTTIIGTVAIVGIIGGIYVIRKAWYGFHRAVGIEPGKMTYVPANLREEKAFKPHLIQVNLSTTQLLHLPNSLKIQLQRIDDKADAYQDWRVDLEQRYQSILTTTENQFALSKLMSEHLPEIISSYHNLHERKLKISSESYIDSDNQALAMLIELLDDIEERLDNLLKECEQTQLQDLQVMKRYLQSRD